MTEQEYIDKVERLVRAFPEYYHVFVNIIPRNICPILESKGYTIGINDSYYRQISVSLDKELTKGICYTDGFLLEPLKKCHVTIKAYFVNGKQETIILPGIAAYPVELFNEEISSTIPEIQVRLFEAAFGKEWHKYITVNLDKQITERSINKLEYKEKL